MNLFELAFICYIYDFFTTFNRSYKSFLNAVGSCIDLYNPEHRKELIYWLNKWGCRQFSLDYHELASKEILIWYKEGYIKLIPQDKKLWELTALELENISGIYDALAEKKASYKTRKGNELSIKVGATGASKILFALRPEIAIPWDEAIRKGLKHTCNGASYVNYLKQAKTKLESLYLSCIKNNIEIELPEIPRVLGREEATVAQLIGEYFWVTETKNCYPPSHYTIQLWAMWSNHKENTVFPIFDNIARLKTFVGGYTGTSYEVDIDIINHSAEYTVLDYGYEPYSKETIPLSKGETQKFLDSLESLNIFDWDKHYEEIGVLDGTSWLVEITLKNGFVYHFKGNNVYPEGWVSFCKAIKKLHKKQFK